ncbi:hypothetical protein ACTHQ4_20050 [Alkalicoccobacillus gibsonii]|uniref:hypothetical protein n=1 Tax=Alkalicoccobacillus gibsonii TaxID=79881 RepID=UPI003F7C5009
MKKILVTLTIMVSLVATTSISVGTNNLENAYTLTNNDEFNILEDRGPNPYDS